MRIAISISPAVSRRRSTGLGVVSRRTRLCQGVGTAHYRALEDDIALGEAWKEHRLSIGWVGLRSLAFWTGCLPPKTRERPRYDVKTVPSRGARLTLKLARSARGAATPIRRSRSPLSRTGEERGEQLTRYKRRTNELLPTDSERPLPHRCANGVASSQSCPKTVPKSHYLNGGSATISSEWAPPISWRRGCVKIRQKVNYWEESHA
jgi:hypothetical protein